MKKYFPTKTHNKAAIARSRIWWDRAIFGPGDGNKFVYFDESPCPQQADKKQEKDKKALKKEMVNVSHKETCFKGPLTEENQKEVTGYKGKMTIYCREHQNPQVCREAKIQKHFGICQNLLTYSPQ